MISFLKKHGTLLGIFMSLLIYTIAIRFYPGGSAEDPAAKGFNWQTNYFCNLMNNKALNGENNPVYVLAIIGMMIVSISIAWFYYNYSKKINQPSFSGIIKYCGIASMLCVSLVFMLHDLLTTVAVIFTLISLFTIIVLLFKERQHFLKWSGVINLLLMYIAAYIYYTRQYIFILAVFQKVVFLTTVCWILCLQYLYKPQQQNS